MGKGSGGGGTVKGAWPKTLAIALLNLQGVVEASSAAGVEGCKCMETAPTTGLNVMNGSIQFYIADATNSSWQNCPSKSMYSYGPSYGLGKCHTWDKGLAPDCKRNEASWCAKSWCYVNATECLHAKSVLDVYFSLPTSASIITPYLNLNLASLARQKNSVSFTQSRASACGRYYSYETCGNHDSFWDSHASDALSGAHLKIAIPAIYFADQYKLDRNGSIIYFNTDISSGADDGWYGMFIDLIERLAQDAGFTYEFQQVSTGSKLLYPESTYTACAYDVARGISDMCAYMCEVGCENITCDSSIMTLSTNILVLFGPFDVIFTA